MLSSLTAETLAEYKWIFSLMLFVSIQLLVGFKGLLSREGEGPERKRDVKGEEREGRWRPHLFNPTC